MVGPRDIGVSFKADITGYMSGLKTMSAGTKAFAGDVNAALRMSDDAYIKHHTTVTDTGQKVAARNKEQTQKIKQSLAQIGTASLAVGATAAVGFGYMIKQTAEFEKQMSYAGAAARASGSDLQQLKDRALEASKTSQFSATEIAKGMTELAKAGLTTQQIIGGGLTATIALASTEQMSLAEAAEVASVQLGAFNLKASDLPAVTNIMAAAAGKAQGSVKELAMGLSQSGNVANAVGLDFGDTNAVLSLFAKSALMGSDAGTSLRTMLLRLTPASKEAAREMAKFNFSAYDAKGNFVGLPELVERLQTSFAGLSAEQRTSALNTIFGQEAIRGVEVLIKSSQTLGKSGADGIIEWKKQISEAGYQAAITRSRMDNLAGDAKKLQSTAQAAVFSNSSGLSGGLRFLTQTATGLVGTLSDIPPAVGTTAVAMIGLTAAVGLTAGAYMKIRPAMSTVLDGLNQMGPAGNKAATGISRLGKAVGIAGVALAGFEIGKTILENVRSEASLTSDEIASAIVQINELDKLGGKKKNKELNRVANYEDIGGALSNRVLNDQKSVWGNPFSDDKSESLKRKTNEGFFKQSGRTVSGMFGGNQLQDSFEHETKRIRDYDKALSDLVKDGNVDQAAEAFKKLRAEYEQNTGDKDSADFLKKNYFKEYQRSLDGLSANKTISEAKKAQEAQKKLNETFADTIQQIKSVKDAYDKINSGAVNSKAASVGYEEAKAQLTTGASGSKSLSEKTEAGRQNISNLMNALDAMKTKVDALNIQGKLSPQQAEVAIRAYNKEITDLAVKAGFSRKEVEALVNSLSSTGPGQQTALTNAQVDDLTRKLGLSKTQAASLRKEMIGVGNARIANATVDSLPKKLGLSDRQAAQLRTQLAGLVANGKLKLTDAQASSLAKSLGLSKDKAIALKNAINGLEDKVVNVKVKSSNGFGVQQYSAPIGPGLPNPTKKADGGIVAAANGRLTDAKIQGPGTLYQWAEPETEGEAFIPLSESKRKRSSLILAEVADMFGYELIAAGESIAMASGGTRRKKSKKSKGSSEEARDKRDEAAANQREWSRKLAFPGITSALLDASGSFDDIASRMETYARNVAEVRAAKSSNKFDTADDYYRKPNVSIPQYRQQLNLSISQATNWRNQLTKIAAIAGDETAAALEAMGERGADAVAKMSRSSIRDVQSMAVRLKELGPAGTIAMRAFNAQTTLDTKRAQSFEANIRTLIQRGQTALATKFVNMGVDSAWGLAENAAKSTPAAMAGLNATLKNAPDLSQFPDAVKIADALQSTPNAGLGAVMQKTSLSAADIIKIVKEFDSTLFSSLSLAATLRRQIGIDKTPATTAQPTTTGGGGSLPTITVYDSSGSPQVTARQVARENAWMMQ